MKEIRNPCILFVASWILCSGFPKKTPVELRKKSESLTNLCTTICVLFIWVATLIAYTTQNSFNLSINLIGFWTFSLLWQCQSGLTSLNLTQNNTSAQSAIILQRPWENREFLLASPTTNAGFAAALMTTTVREQHSRSHHKGTTSMQTHLAVR